MKTFLTTVAAACFLVISMNASAQTTPSRSKTTQTVSPKAKEPVKESQNDPTKPQQTVTTKKPAAQNQDQTKKQTNGQSQVKPLKRKVKPQMAPVKKSEKETPPSDK